MAAKSLGPCPKCGVERCELHCGARRRSDGKPCTQPKGWGTDHPGIGNCRFHLGSTQNHKKAAAEEKARQAVADFSARRDVEPTEALLEVLGLRAGQTGFLAQRIAELDDVERLVDHSGDVARPSVWVDMYDTALKEYGRIAKAGADVNIEERRVRIEESIGRQLDGVIRRVLDGVFAGLLELAVDATVLEAFQAEAVPGIVRGAVAGLAVRGPTPPAAKP